MLTDEQLEAIEARAAAATPGPWFSPDVFDVHSTKIGTHADAAFIAAARTDVPALCAEVRALRAQLAALAPLAAALREYGDHQPQCPRYNPRLDRLGGGCTCGFSTALDLLEKALEPAAGLAGQDD